MASGSYCENKQFREYFTGLLVLATYAKFLNREDIYEQARDSYDAGVRQYNDKYCPKKGFWAKYKDNFIEGMGCINGCIGGPCSLTHEIRNKMDVDKYGHESKEKTILDAIKHFQN